MHRKKNILFLLPDQLRPDFLSCYGADFINTPNIDSICDGGVRFERCVSPSPLCIPARASLMTGLNGIRNGVLFNNAWLRPDHSECGIDTWPQILSANGYHTEAIGKMHFYPWDITEGFDHKVVAEDKRFIHIQDDYSQYLQSRGLKRVHGIEQPGYTENKGAADGLPIEDQIDNWVGDRASEFIEGYNQDEPFALMVGFPGPHCPYDPPVEIARKFDGQNMPLSIPATTDSRVFKDFFLNGFKMEWCQLDYTDFNEDHKRKIRANYCGLIEIIDNQVGKIISALKKRNMLEDTIIILASDHGDLLGDYDFMGKHYFYETSIRVPLIINHPDHHGSESSSSIISLTDLNSTLLSFAGIQPAVNKDSMPICSQDGFVIADRDYVFGCTDLGFMVSDNNWKLCRYRNGSTHLFNLIEDPDEQHNLAMNADFSIEKERLDAILQENIAKSIVDGHEDKAVNACNTLGKGEFGQTGWQRRYPSPVI